MKRGLLFVSLLFLAACTQPNLKTGYTLKLDAIGAAAKDEIVAASVRVLTHQVESIGGNIRRTEINSKPADPQVILHLSNENLRDPLNARLSAPFSFRLMREARQGETPAIKLLRNGDFVETGLTEKHVLWVRAGTGTLADGKGFIVIDFTDDGKKILNEAFAQDKGKKFGIFVRNSLMSLIVNRTEVKDRIQIDGVPSPELAAIFSDDVNVGSHVTFEPLP